MEGAFPNAGQRSTFIRSVWIFRPESHFSNELWGPPKVVVVHQSNPFPNGGGSGGAQTTRKYWERQKLLSCAPHSPQTSGKKRWWLHFDIQIASIMLKDGPQVFCRILETTDISLIGTSLVCFLFLHYRQVDLPVICCELTLRRAQSWWEAVLGVKGFALRWFLVWIPATTLN